MTLALSLSCLLMSVTQPSPKLSQAMAVTGLAPSRLHIAHSNAPVSLAGHDADQVVGRDARHFPRQVDGLLDAGLARLGTVRAARQGAGQGIEAPARTLAGRAGAEIRRTRFLVGLIHGCSPVANETPGLPDSGRRVYPKPPGGSTDASRTDALVWVRDSLRRLFQNPKCKRGASICATALRSGPSLALRVL